MAVFNEGEFADAAKAFRQAGRFGVRSTEGRWVDSVCYHAMIGECLYQMGELNAASEEFTAAVTLFLAHRTWLLRVELTPNLEPSASGPQRPITWGPSTRRAVPARFPDRYPIVQGSPSLEAVVRQGGGVFSPQEIYLINAHEIMRCTALAIRRRHDIMGQACPHDPLTGQLVQALTLRPAPPNHWSQAWVGTLLGLAYASAGRSQEAVSELGKSAVAASQFDHHLTGAALLTLGKLAFEQEQYANAAGFFLEASLSAAWFEDASLVEESLRWGALTHLVAGQPGMYAPLAPAAAWAQRQSDFVEASTLVSMAEISATVNEPATALTLLEQARRLMARSKMQAGHVGARFQYVTALTSYETQNLKAGDAALAALMSYQQKSSQRLFELGLIDRLATTGAVTERIASELYGQALREPLAKDWTVAPVETLTLVLTPHLGPLEHWFELTLRRKETEKAVEISDRIRRHRFFSTLPMGGRLDALRWVLEAPDGALGERPLLQRQELLARFPTYAEMSREAQALRMKQEALPLVPEDEAGRKAQTDLMAQLAKISIAQELLLREIALRRVAADFVFPPELHLKALQPTLPAGTLILSYLATDKALHVFTLSRDNYTHAQLSGAQIRKEVAALLREMGHVDKNQTLEVSALQSQAWQESARQLWTKLTAEASLPEWDQLSELVIVPDGPLWYLPFEALPVGDEATHAPLISKVPVRYAPTLALSVPDRRPASRSGETAVVVGQLFPREDAAVGQAALEQLRTVLPGVAKLDASLAVPSALLAVFCDRLVVLSDIQQDAAGYDWSPMQIDRNKPGSLLSSWLRLPWGGPQQVVLPGFHTAAETALKRSGNGEEIFLAVCGLMSCGSRTVLISRWRTGGKTSYDLVREFVQELPHSSAAKAWQRSVFLASQDELVVEREPRVKPTNLEVSVKADHPFLWAAYLLVDTGLSPSAVEDTKPAAVAEAKDAAK